jgi:cytochrome b
MQVPFIQRHKILLIHISFWLVYASFFFYQISFTRDGREPEWDKVIKDFSFHIIAMLTICYFNYFVLLPRFQSHRHLGRYLLEFIPSFSVMIYLVLLGKRYLWEAFQQNHHHWSNSPRFAVQVVWSALFMVAFVGLLKFVENWFELEAKKKELENERLTSELRFLKAQINPHFLFNTLNNLYYLAYIQSPNTTEVISKLSQMMRYMIYDSNHPKVPLNKELEYMQNYISLEKLRLNEDVPIQFQVKGNIESAFIMPLILITFLENAFKHGVSTSVTHSWITASIEVQNNKCYFNVQNSKIPQSGKTVIEKSGIGLQNVKRRLELSYPNNYTLNVQDSEEVYSVE